MAKTKTDYVVLDALGQELRAGNYVFFYSNVYQIHCCGEPGGRGRGTVRMILISPSSTTRPVAKYSGDMVLIDDETIIKWKLTQGIE